MLKERRDRLRQNAEIVGSDDRETLALKQQYALTEMANLKKDLMSVQSQKRNLEARQKMRRTNVAAGERLAVTVTEADINRWIDKDPYVEALFDKLDQCEERLNAETARLRKLSRNAGADPVLQRLRTDKKAIQDMIKSKRSSLRSLAERELQDQAGTAQVAKGNEDQQELDILNELERSLTAEIKAHSDENRNMNSKTLDLSALQEEVEQLRGTSSQVSTALENLNVEQLAPARVRTIENAVVPTTRDEKKRIAMIVLIAAGSFFGGLFGVAFLELQTRKVDSSEEIPTELGLQIVGTLPLMRARSIRGPSDTHKQLPSEIYWQNLMLESIDATRMMLVHVARTESHRVVMITSAVGGEGKTSLSSHLATSLARSGLRTLLIDADLRKPSIHRLFDLPVAPGLSELLRGEIDLAGSILDTVVPELKVLTSGNCDRQTIRLLAQGCIGPLFSQFKDQFDFVIVDSSPILPVADGSIIAQQADAVLFSILSDVSRKTRVFAALQRFQTLGVRVLGAVVTESLSGGYGKGYHSKAYYGSMPYGDMPYGTLPESKADLLSDPQA
jgi:capsular exopolysaccharide synthesis family protein